MVDIFTWSIIIIADFVFILLGLFSAYKFIRAFLDKRDLMKNQIYLIYAIILIVIIPPIITYGGLKFVDSYDGHYAQTGVNIQANDYRGINKRIAFDSKEYAVKPWDKQELSLSITNDIQEDLKLSVNIKCVNGNCDQVADLLIPKEKQIDLFVKQMIILPISINVRNETALGEYDFDITLKDENNSIYDFIQVKLSIE